MENCEHCKHGKKPWYKEKIFQVSFVFLVLLGMSYLIPGFEMYNEGVFKFLGIIWIPVLAGLLISALISSYIPEQYVARYLSGKSWTQIPLAALLGFIMTACSHGILVIFVSLYKKGASVPAAMTFLLASPWANFSVTLMLIGFFGILRGFAIILSALAIAIVTGFIFMLYERRGWIEKSKNVKIQRFSIWKDAKKRVLRKIKNINISSELKTILSSMWDFTKMVVWWILIGIIGAGLVHAFVPENILTTYFGPTVVGVILTLIAATIIEVCSEGSSPIAFALFEKTGALGNAFAFLMAGVATDYTELGIITTNIGKKTAIAMLLTTLPQIILVSILMNMFL